MKLVLNNGKELFTENYNKIEVSHMYNKKIERDTYSTEDDGLVASLITHQIIYGTGIAIRLFYEESDIEGILIPYRNIHFTETTL